MPEVEFLNFRLGRVTSSLYNECFTRNQHGWRSTLAQCYSPPPEGQRSSVTLREGAFQIYSSNTTTVQSFIEQQHGSLVMNSFSLARAGASQSRNPAFIEFIHLLYCCVEEEAEGDPYFSHTSFLLTCLFSKADMTQRSGATALTTH